MDDNPAHSRDQLLAMLMFSAATLMTTALLVAGYHLPPESGELGVVFPPWMEESEIAASIILSGGFLAGGTRFSNIYVAVAPDAGFADRVRQNGAWLTTAARGLCAPVGATQT